MRRSTQQVYTVRVVTIANLPNLFSGFSGRVARTAESEQLNNATDMNKFYGKEKFQPLVILRRILVLQTLFYLAFAGVCAVMSFFASVPFYMSTVFDPQHLNLYSTLGWEAFIGVSASSFFWYVHACVLVAG